MRKTESTQRLKSEANEKQNWVGNVSGAADKRSCLNNTNGHSQTQTRSGWARTRAGVGSLVVGEYQGRLILYEFEE